MNLGDWPLVPKNEIPYPIFSWCGAEDYNDIILPTYDITKSSIEAMGRSTLILFYSTTFYPFSIKSTFSKLQFVVVL